MKTNPLMKPCLNQYFLLMFLVCMIGCKQEKNEGIIDLSKNHIISLRDIFSECKVIQLETTSNCLISKISQIRYFKDTFYILDRKQQKIFRFDKDGKFISSISNQGRGPGEYYYATHINMDSFNNHLMVLSSSVKQLLVLDLSGKFIEQHQLDEGTLNEVFALNDSVLLFSSFTDYQSIYYCRKNKRVIDRDFKYPVFLNQFIPYFNTFTYNQRTHTTPALLTNIMDVSEMNPVHSYSYNFGTDNNSQQQVTTLLEELDGQDYGKIRLHKSIGKGKSLNHHIIKNLESNRFRFSLIAVEECIKHVIVDKHDDKSYVFDAFKEGVVINMHFNIHLDKYMIAYEYRDITEEKAKEFFGLWYPYYTASFYSELLLSNKDKDIIKKHNPIKDNPFLMIYTIKD